MATAPTRRPTPPRLLWVTEASTGTNHLVTEAAFVDGIRASGSYRGICGAEFSAAPMIAAPRRACSACRGRLVADRTSCRSKPRGTSWWRRLRRPKPGRHNDRL